MYKIRILAFVVLLSCCYSVSSKDDLELDTRYSQSSYGGIGLIQTPTARFSNDGQLTFGASFGAPYNQLYAKMQFFPWLETVVKYSEITTAAYNRVQTLKDKGFDVKVRLIQERENFPEIAIGFLDFAGTGIFSSEYLVATKGFNNIDLSVGLGWGKLAGVDHITNPISIIDSERKNPRGFWSLALNRGGKLNLKNYFAGENTSVFAGLEYFTPIENLSLKVEYDTTDYTSILGKEELYNETGNIVELDSRINYALNYRLNMSERDRVDISLGLIRGNTIYANFAVQSNLNFAGTPKTIMGAEKIRNTNLPGGESFKSLNQNHQEFLFQRTIREMAHIGFVTHSVSYNDDEILAEISQSRFQNTSHTIDLASRVLANNSPKNIKKITVINVDNGIETTRSTVLRDDLIKSVAIGPLEEDLIKYNLHFESTKDEITIKNDFLYPNFYWEIKPRLNSTLQHQEKFLFWQLQAELHSVYSIKQGLYFTTDIGINIDNNFEDYTYHIPDGELHYVRQDRRRYLTEGESGLRRMSLDYMVDLNPNLKAKLSLGYLETMFGGFGGELLYIPDSRHWALGVDAHWVKQREFDQRFSFRDYNVLTGFVNFYRDIPFYDMRLKLSAGKFLGKDIGTMIDLSRRFDTGARIGAFAALTDCDADCVGEGSFHKGIYFELPMNLFYIQSTTRNKTGYSWSPLTKNAGQKLELAELYELVSDASDEVEDLRLKSWSIGKIFSGFGSKPKKEKFLN